MELGSAGAACPPKALSHVSSPHEVPRNGIAIPALSSPLSARTASNEVNGSTQKPHTTTPSFL
jgi:hypothetical protein